MSDDNWFYDSIKLYSTLQMYDLQMKPSHIRRANAECVCLAGIHTNTGKTEVQLLELPAKLLLTDEEADRCKGNDFDIRSGGFFDHPITSFCVHPASQKAFVSFEKQAGVAVMNLDCLTAGVTECLLEQVKDYNLAASDSTNELLLTKSTSDPIYQLDCADGSATTLPVPQEWTETDSPIVSLYSEPENAILLNTATGAVSHLDLRTSDVVSLQSKNKISEYVISVLGNKLVTLDKEQNVSLCDTRKPGQLLVKGNLGIAGTRKTMVVQLSTGDKFSVSGFGETVEVFQVCGDEIEPRFSHEGHSNVDDLPGGVVTDHLWMTDIADDLLVSVCENGTLNCWEYKCS